MTARGTGVRGFAKGKAFVINDFSRRNPFEGIPAGSILVAPAITLSDSAMIDFRKVVGMVTFEPDTDGDVCLLARGMGIPAIVGVAEVSHKIVSGDRLLIRNLDVVINPDLETVMEFEELRAAASPQLRLDF